MRQQKMTKLSSLKQLFEKPHFAALSKIKSRKFQTALESVEKYAKFWLDPIILAESHGYLSKQLKEIRELIQEHKEAIRRKWDEHVTNHRQS
ncbi:MAG: DUF4160 domain-containing protein [Verrucomicrobia bacterium]|nr:DUF4160 domain-containing protein [Verrucomicrobiota bacterium]